MLLMTHATQETKDLTCARAACTRNKFFPKYTFHAHIAKAQQLRVHARQREKLRVSHLFDGEAVENVFLQEEQPVVVNMPA